MVKLGVTLDSADPARSAFEGGAGLLGRYIVGIVMFTAGLSTVVGCAVTLVTMLSVFFKNIEKYQRWVCIGFIILATLLMATIGQPSAMLVFAGAFNGLVLPVMMIIFLIASHNKRVMGEDYHHPLWMTIGAVLVIIIMGYSGITGFPKVFTLFQ